MNRITGKKEGVAMMTVALMFVYVLLTVAGLTLIKLGSRVPSMFAFTGGAFSIRLGAISVAGLLCYLVNFLNAFIPIFIIFTYASCHPTQQ